MHWCLWGRPILSPKRRSAFLIELRQCQGNRPGFTRRTVNAATRASSPGRFKPEIQESFGWVTVTSCKLLLCNCSKHNIQILMWVPALAACLGHKTIGCFLYMLNYLNLRPEKGKLAFFSEVIFWAPTYKVFVHLAVVNRVNWGGSSSVLWGLGWEAVQDPWKVFW